MTIAFLTPEFPHQSLKKSAGIGTSIENLSLGLIESGFKVVIFAIFQNHDEVYQNGNLTIVSIAKRRYKVFGWYLNRKHIEQRIRKEIKLRGIDIIEAPDWTGISAFMKFEIPLVVRLHGTDAYFCKLEGRKQKWKNFIFEKLALKNADALVSVSNYTANVTKKIFSLNQSIKTIYNSINTNSFEPMNVPIIKGQLLYFGTIIRKKGILELAGIFNQIITKYPKASLLLIGTVANDFAENTSTLKLFYNLLSTKAKEKVKYLDAVSYDEIKLYISKANVVVLPSFAEAFPMTWLETLALKKPLVSSNIGWAQELMINNVTGYTISPKNHVDYANKILELLNNDDLCLSFGKSGREHVEKYFSAKAIIPENVEFYKQLIQS